MAKRKRGNGEGSVHQVKGKKLWRAVVTIGIIDGKRKRAIAYGKSKAEALDELRKLQAKGPSPLRSSEPINVATLLRRYLANCESRVTSGDMQATTCDSYQTVVKTHLLPRIGSLLLSKCDSSVVKWVLSDMADEGKSMSKRAHALTIMRQAFALAVEEGTVSINPAIGVKTPRAQQHDIKPLTPEQVHQFLDEIREHRLYPLFVTALGTGMRQGELLGLRWEDVDLVRGTLAVRRKVVEVRNVFHEGSPKTKSGRRQVTLPRIVVDALVEQRKLLFTKGLAGCPLVFPNRTGGPLRRQNLGRMMKRLLADSGLEPIRFHDHRHTAASLLLAAGENVKVVQERLGHSRVQTTLDVYGHNLPGIQERAAERINECLQPRGNKRGREIETG